MTRIRSHVALLVDLPRDLVYAEQLFVLGVVPLVEPVCFVMSAPESPPTLLLRMKSR